MKNNFLIWALIDDQPGNQNQIYGVLNQLKLPFKIQKVHYNFLSRLPNFLLQILGGSIHLKKKINLKTPYPKLILSCGRRTFPLAKKIRNKIFPTPLFIHFMYPRGSYKTSDADIIFTPQHDKVKKKSNLIETIGAANLINKINYKKKTSQGKKKIILILLGGNHGKYKLKTDDVNYIINEVTDKIKDNGYIFLSTSRRTPEKIIKLIENLRIKNKKLSQVFYPNRNKIKNPILEMLKDCDEIVVTGDSMSMISEACSTNKPVRIFYNDDICSKKHTLFCNYLIKNNYAFSFETLLNKCHKIKTLETTKFVSEKILLHIKNDRKK